MGTRATVRFGLPALLLVALWMLAAACGQDDTPAPREARTGAAPNAERSSAITPASIQETPRPPPEPDPPRASAAAQAREAPPAPVRIVHLADPGERVWVEAILAELPAGTPDITVADQPLPGGAPYVLTTWVAIGHQRHDTLELSLSDLRRGLSGVVGDWRSLGGSPGPITVVVAGDADAAAGDVGIDGFAVNALRPPSEDVAAIVAATPGALGLVPIDELRPGTLPLVIEGHDPLRDPSQASPLARVRWIAADDAATSAIVALALGWSDAVMVDPLGLVATGDFIPTRCVGRAVERLGGGDFDAIFTLAGDHLRAADLVVVSMEVAAPGVLPPTPCRDLQGQFILTASPAAIDALAAAGVDVVTTAGNHAGDCHGGCPWPNAVLETINQLERAGIAPIGTGPDLASATTPLIVERSGVTLAFLSYDTIAGYYFATEDRAGTAPATAEGVAADVRAATQLADHVILALSWGEEYVSTTTGLQRAIVDAAIEAGASLIIGNQPHWLQPLVQVADGLVAYALGNFVFDQSWSIGTTQSVLLEVGFSKDRILGYRVRPVVIRRDYQPELVDPRGAEGQQILARLWRATDNFLARETP